MKRSTLYAGAVLACALGLSACGGGSGDLPLTVQIAGGVTKEGLKLRNQGNGEEIDVPAGVSSVTFKQYLSTDDEFNIIDVQRPSNVSGCTFVNNKARANYYTVYTVQPTVFCTIKPHPLTVTVNGLTGAGLVLVNGADRESVAPTGLTTFTFKMADVPEDGPYGVTILTQPDTQTCTVSGGSGLMTATGPGSAPTVTCGPKT